MIRPAAGLGPLLLLWAAACWPSDWIDLSERCLRVQRPLSDAAGAPAPACPEAVAALEADRWSALLDIPPESLSAWSLTELSAIARHYRQPATSAPVPVASLPAILADLPRLEEEQALSTWQRLLAWLEGLLHGQAPEMPEWLTGVELPDSLLTWIWYGTLTLILLLAVAVVGNEIRHRSRRRYADRPAQGIRAEPPRAVPAGGPQCPRRQLADLVAGLVAALRAAGMLPTGPLTHRTVARAPGLTDGQRRSAASLCLAAERSVYGGWRPAPAEVAAHLTAGRRLLDELAGERP